MSIASSLDGLRKRPAEAESPCRGSHLSVPDCDAYPPIGDYALIGDCHSAALVSRDGSIDWCCLPRFDSGSAFGRLLDRARGGHCSFAPVATAPWECARAYLDDTLVLETTFDGAGGEAKLTRLLPDARRASAPMQRQILRVIEGVRGTVELEVRVAPRFDYGQVRPWIRRHGHRLHSAIGGNDALLVWCEQELDEDPDHELVGRVHGRRRRPRAARRSRYCAPELVDAEPPSEPEPARSTRSSSGTVAWWRKWAQRFASGAATSRPPGGRGSCSRR